MIDAVGLRVVLVALAGWVNRHQLEVIEYLREENRVLKEHVGGRRLHFLDPAASTRGDGIASDDRTTSVNGRRDARHAGHPSLAPAADRAQVDDRATAGSVGRVSCGRFVR